MTKPDVNSEHAVVHLTWEKVGGEAPGQTQNHHNLSKKKSSSPRPGPVCPGLVSASDYKYNLLSVESKRLEAMCLTELSTNTKSSVSRTSPLIARNIPSGSRLLHAPASRWVTNVVVNNRVDVIVRSGGDWCRCGWSRSRFTQASYTHVQLSIYEMIFYSCLYGITRMRRLQICKPPKFVNRSSCLKLP